MTTSTFYAETSDGWIRAQAQGTNYEVVRAGGGTTTETAQNYFYVGQNWERIGTTWTGIEGFTIWQGFVLWTTSDIPDTDTVSAVTLSLWKFSNDSAADFTVNVRVKAWGATLTTADWDTTYAGTLLATLDTSTFGSLNAYIDFSSQAGFPAAVNKTGTTEVVLLSANTETDVEPTQREYVGFASANDTGTTHDPKLVVVHSGGPVGPPVIRISGNVRLRTT